MKSAVALPVGILAALAVAMFIFICWWFPRHYKKGVKADMDEVDENRRHREAYELQARAAEDAEPLPPVYSATSKPQPKLTYVAPVAGY